MVNGQSEKQSPGKRVIGKDIRPTELGPNGCDAMGLEETNCEWMAGKEEEGLSKVQGGVAKSRAEQGVRKGGRRCGREPGETNETFA